MCNCLKEMSEAAEKHIKERIEEKTKVAEYDSPIGFLENEGYGFNGTVLFMPFTVKYKRQKTNGQPEQNWRTKKSNVMFGFCPFCGKKKDEVKGF